MKLFKRALSGFLSFAIAVTTLSEPLTAGAFRGPEQTTVENVQTLSEDLMLYDDAVNVAAQAEIKWTSEQQTGDAEIEVTPDSNGFIIDEEGRLMGYTGSGGDIVIPDNVTWIGDNVFESNTAVTSVVMSDAVGYIGSQSFKGCTNLVSVKLSESLNGFTYESFMGCTSLKTVDLPASVEFIGANIFRGCTNLESVTMHEGVKEICVQAFADCPKLREITLPSTIEKMELNTFDHSGLRKAVVSEGISEIPVCTFWGCSELETVILPDSIKTIGKSAFQECDKLKNITLPSGLLSVGDFAFSSSGLESIVVPASVTSIGEGAFSNCTSLTSAVINADLPELAESIFAECISLTDVVIPDSITVIKRMAFNQCKSLKEFDIPDALEEIGEGAFGWVDFETFTVPEKITELPNWAFDHSQLKNITFHNNCTKIGDYAFEGCEKLTDISLPDSLKTIGDGAFRSCTQLTEIVIPDSVTDLGAWAFHCCYGVESAVIGKGVTELNEGAFYDCDHMTSIKLPDGLTKIADNVFVGCNMMRSLTLPTSISELGSDVIIWWKTRYINYPGTQEQWEKVNKQENTFRDWMIVRCNFTKEEDYLWDPNFRYDENTGILTWDQRPGIPINTSDNGFEDYACYGFEIEGADDPEIDCVFSWYDIDWSTPEQKRTGLVSQPDTNLPLAFAMQIVEKDKQLHGEYKLYISGGPGHNIYGMDGSEPFIYNFTGGNVIDNLGVPGYLRFAQDGTTVEWDKVAGAVGYLVRYECTNGEVYYEQQRENLSLRLGDTGTPRYKFLNCKISVCSVDKNGNMSAWSEPLLNSQDNLIDKELSHYSLNGSVNASGNIPATVSWSIKDLDTVSDAAIFVEIPENAAIAGNVIYMGGETYPITPNNRGEFTVPVTSSAGKFSFYFKRSGATELHTYALLQYYKDGYAHREYIGQIDEEIKDISIEMPTKTSQETVTVSGSAAAEASITIYADDKLVSTIKANKSGDYCERITLPDLTDGKTYVIKAVSDGHEATGEVTYESTVPEVISFVMSYNGKTYDLLSGVSYTLVIPVKPIPFSFDIKMKNSGNVDTIYVCSTQYGVSKYLEAKWDDKTKSFTANGFFDDDDHSYSVGKLSVFFTQRTEFIETDCSANYLELFARLFFDDIEYITIQNNISKTMTEYISYKKDDVGKGNTIDAWRSVYEQSKYDSLDDIDEISSSGMNIIGYIYNNDNIFEIGGKKFFIYYDFGTDTKHSLFAADLDDKEFYSATIELVSYSVYSGEVMPVSDESGFPDCWGTNTRREIGKAAQTAGNVIGEIYQDHIDGACNTLYGDLDAQLGRVFDYIESLNLPANERYAAIDAVHVLRYTYAAGYFIAWYLQGGPVKGLAKGATKNGLKWLLKEAGKMLLGQAGEAIGNYGIKKIKEAFQKMGIDPAFVDLLEKLDKLSQIEDEDELEEFINDLIDEFFDEINPLKDFDFNFENLCYCVIDNWCISPFPYDMEVIRDPSGTVYEAVMTNPLPGVRATAYWIPADTDDPDFFNKAPDESKKQLWNASEYGYENPTYTDNTGYYAWDVPEGWWQVKYELDGYETAYSEWLPVPPPQLDVNIPLVSNAAPKAETTFDANTVTVTFDKYIDPATINGVILTGQGGDTLTYTVEYSKGETAADGTVYAKVFTLTADRPVHSVEIPETVLSYCGSSAEAVIKENPDVPAEEQFDGKVILRREGADDQKFDNITKAIAFIKSQKKQKYAYELIVNDSITEKSLSFPNNINSLVIRTTSKGKLTLSGTSISLPCSAILDCDITQISGKPVSLKTVKGASLTITRFTAVIGTISGAKGSKLVINADITAETVKTFDSINGEGTLTIKKALSGANIGTTTLAYDITIAKKIVVPAITGNLTIAADEIKSGTTIFQYTGKAAFDGSKVTIGDGSLEAFAYKKDVRAMENGKLTVDGTDYPDFEQAFAAMQPDKEYTVVLNGDVPAAKLTLPKTVKKLTIDGCGNTVNIEGALSLTPKYMFEMKNLYVKANKGGTSQAVTINAQGGLLIDDVTFDAKSVALKGKGELKLGDTSKIDTVSGFTTAKITGAVAIAKSIAVPTIELTSTAVVTLDGKNATVTAKNKFSGEEGSQLVLKPGFKAITLPSSENAVTGNVILNTDALSGTVQIFATKISATALAKVFAPTKGELIAGKSGKVDIKI